MLVQKKSRPIYLLSSNLQIRLWHCYLSHVSNTRVIQASKLVNKIEFGEAIGPDNKLSSSDSEPDDKNNKYDKDVDSKPPTTNKAIEYNFNGIEKVCKACIESKHIRIVKSKKITSITKML